MSRVNVPLPLASMVTLPEVPMVTPVGWFAMVAVYVPAAICAEVTGKVTVPPMPWISVPDCVPTVTDLAGKMVSVNAVDVAVSMVSVRVLYVFARVLVFPARVNVPAPLVMVTWPCTVTPDGRVATAAECVPSAIFAVVTVKVAVPAVPALRVLPPCAPTETVFADALAMVKVKVEDVAPSRVRVRVLYTP